MTNICIFLEIGEAFNVIVEDLQGLESNSVRPIYIGYIGGKTQITKVLMLATAFTCFLNPNIVRAANEPAITESTSISEETGVERDFSEDGVLKSFRFLENHEVVAEFEVEDRNVYQITELGREYIGWVRLEDTVDEADGLNYTEPSWGPLLSTSATVGGANGFGNTGTYIAALLCTALPTGVDLERLVH